MKILFVAMAESIHTARWISQITDQSWDIHLFPSNYSSTYHREIKNVTTHRYLSAAKAEKDQFEVLTGIKFQFERGFNFARMMRDEINPDARARQLCALIKKIQPDVVHSLEFQSSGYLTLRAKQLFKGKFPLWIATNWGSDIYWYERFNDHQLKIKAVLKECDFYSCECQRDICLAQKNGFKGKILPVLPNAGGLNLTKIKPWHQPLNERKIVLLKGKTGTWGKVLVGLEALKLCAPELKNYEIMIYLGFDNPIVSQAAQDFQQETGIKTVVYQQRLSHEALLKLHGAARISIGLSLSDGISTSFLEAMAMGSFPIQSNTSCAEEWIKSGKTGILVPPEDPKIIAKAIKRALTDNTLVGGAAAENWQTAREKLDDRKIRQKVVDFYRLIGQDCVQSLQKKTTLWSSSIWLTFIQLVLALWIIMALLLWVFTSADSKLTWISTNKQIPSLVRNFVGQTHILIYGNRFAATYIYRTQQ